METELEGNITMFSIPFTPFLVTPTLEDVRKELEGTKVEPLLNVIVSHLSAMKDGILDHGTTMLNLYFRWRQQIEARPK